MMNGIRWQHLVAFMLVAAGTGCTAGGEDIGTSGDDEGNGVAESALIAPPPVTECTNIVVNGGFESPWVGHPGLGFFGKINGWKRTFGPNIEIQNHVAGSPVEGDQFVELDSYGPTGISQTLATVEGSTYRLSFAFSARAGTPVQDNVLGVMWDGPDVAELTADGSGLSDTQWNYHTYYVTASSDKTSLEFEDRGWANTVGTYLDDVVVFRDNDMDGVPDCD